MYNSVFVAHFWTCKHKMNTKNVYIIYNISRVAIFYLQRQEKDR